MNKRSSAINRKLYWNLLKRYFYPLLGPLLLMLIILYSIIALQLFNPYLLRTFIDSAAEGGNEKNLITIAIMYTAVAVSGQMLSTVLTYLGEKIGWRATNAIRKDMAAHYLFMDTSKQNAFSSGEIIQRIDGDVNTLQNFFSHFFVKLLGNLSIIAGVLTLLYIEDWRIGATLTLFAFIALLFLEKIRYIAEPFWVKEREINAEFIGFLNERFKGREDIRSNGGIIYVMQIFHNFLRKWFPVLRKAQLFSYAMWMTTIFVFSIGSAMVFSVGGYLYLNKAITIGTLFLTLQFMDLLIDPIEKIREQLIDFQKAHASIKRVIGLFSIEPAPAQSKNMRLDSGAIEVEFKDVILRYEEGITVLNGINFRLESGRKLGLLGRTGSGKSSLARLLLQLYKPSAGNILLNGIEASCYDPREIRRNIGFITQEVKLTHSSLRDNITLFNPDISDEKIMKAIAELALNRWFTGLSNGLDTLLLGNGIGVSAGEAQLIALLRVLLLEPGLVILDEASSRLDKDTEAMIEHAIDKLLAGRTAIIIAHKLSTIQRTDEIMIIENGRIMEHGQREQLASCRSTRFYRLSQLETIDGEVVNE
ncbi:ABC transporter ATP-binding protein [Paenibacillus sp. 2TAB23]|uniref:ABC transporter ATP-binding protein n=1 Tax=Paenibacillus sp. 2TAB23 TaxID=3233004 RepID=UPI003F94FAC1